MSDSIYSHRLFGRAIRLLELIPGKWPDAPSCRLFSTHLDREPHFEALSYVWGDPLPKIRIKCNNQDIDVSTHLAHALVRLRSPTRSRIVWADAICINQDDMEEKNNQVSLMQAIYSCATRVVVCMPHEEMLGYVAREAASIMKRIYRNCRDAVELHNFDWLGSSELVRPIIALDKIEESERQSWWPALRKFFDCSWFTRIWCVQEIVLSQEAVVLFGMDEEVTWDIVGITATWLQDQKRRNLLPESKSLSIRMEDAYRRYSSTTYGASELLFALADYQSCKATDPRDKVYALLGLIQTEYDNPLMEVDYNKSVREVYIDAARAVLQATGDLSLLSAVGT